MALSNIFREPRRELTESAVGVVLTVGFLGLDYAFAIWLQAYAGVERVDSSGGVWHNVPWPLGMLCGIFIIPVVTLALVATHAIGEGACNFFERHGFRLRPRRGR